MLEPCLSQAAGLQGLTPQISPKLIAMASHGNQQGELALLWSLCSTWVDMGLSVLVIDGHVHESLDNPGLFQLLSDPLGQVPSDRDSVAWSVLPAANGLTCLTSPDFSSGTLEHYLHKYEVVVVYANATVVSTLFKGSDLTPLLVVSPLKSSSLTAYQAMKQLLLNAHLHPTVANITLEYSKTPFETEPMQNLQDCAMSFLGLVVKPVNVSARADGETSRGEISRLALRLLESAVLLERQTKPRTH
jgi:hypothetical protein